MFKSIYEVKTSVVSFIQRDIIQEKKKKTSQSLFCCCLHFFVTVLLQIVTDYTDRVLGWGYQFTDHILDVVSNLSS